MEIVLPRKKPSVDIRHEYYGLEIYTTLILFGFQGIKKDGVGPSNCKEEKI